jgi:hypothetical protein
MATHECANARYPHLCAVSSSMRIHSQDHVSHFSDVSVRDRFGQEERRRCTLIDRNIPRRVGSVSPIANNTAAAVSRIARAAHPAVPATAPIGMRCGGTAGGHVPIIWARRRLRRLKCPPISYVRRPAPPQGRRTPCRPCECARSAPSPFGVRVIRLPWAVGAPNGPENSSNGCWALPTIG